MQQLKTIVVEKEITAKALKAEMAIPDMMLAVQSADTYRIICGNEIVPQGIEIRIVPRIAGG